MLSSTLPRLKKTPISLLIRAIPLASYGNRPQAGLVIIIIIQAVRIASSHHSSNMLKDEHSTTRGKSGNIVTNPVR
jgi:hypothetical protein